MLRSFWLRSFACVALLLVFNGTPMSLPAGGSAPVPLKNLVYFEGVRENLLVGYGLVVGLSATGDSLRSSPFTRESVVAMLNRLGVNTRLGGPGLSSSAINTRNTAAVMVTAKLPPFARQGTPIDVTVSAMGDARSLRGGTLLVTPLMGADGEVYAVAQGTLASSGFQASGQTGAGGQSGTSSVTRGVPTAASISNGALIEREVAFRFQNHNYLHLSLRHPNFTTATRIASVIQRAMPSLKAEAIDPATVRLEVAGAMPSTLPLLVAKIENLYVVPDIEGRVVIDERDGVIVIGNDVRVSTVAVSHGNLTISVQESFDVSQPTNLVGVGGTSLGAGQGATGGAAGSPFGGVQTMAVQSATIGVTQDGDRKIGMVRGVSLRELVDALNAFNLPLADLSAVLRAIDAAGALHAKLEIR